MARLRRDAQAQPALSRVMESWLTAVDLAGRSRKTLTLYRESVTGFIAAAGDVPVSEVTADTVRAYLLGLRATHKPSSIATRFRCLRAFLSWCEREGRIDRLPTRTVEPPANPATAPAGFTDDELVRLLATCPSRTALGARNRALLLTLAGTGLRLHEVAGLRREDVLRAGVTDQYIRIVGKGSKERTISLEPLIRQAVADWLEYRSDDDPALWLGERGPLTSRGIYQIVKQTGRRAGVEDVHPHRFRNTALSNMLKANMDPAAVQKIAGHASIAQLQHYVKYSEELRANDLLQKAQPLSRIDWGKGKKKRS